MSPSRTPPASTEQAAAGGQAQPGDVTPTGIPRASELRGAISSAHGGRHTRARASEERWARSPALGGRELVLTALAGVLLALITTWPLVAHLPSRIAPDLGDPVRTAWQVAWVGHAMLHDPAHIFDANAFYPHALSLAFSDSLLGYGPSAFFGSGTVAALVRYNLLFLFAWSLCFFGAYLLARELGLRKLGAAAAGAAFAYAPYRVTEAGHLHVISSGGIPLALFLLVRGYRRGHRGLVLGGWLVSAWQVSLGFTLGLQFTYVLALLALLLLWHWWRARAADSAGSAAEALQLRRLLAVTAVGVAVVAAVGVYEARPYLKIAHDYPTAKRTIREVKTYSAGPPALLAASSQNRVWGDATAGLRARVHSKNESVFFPGGLLLVLALVGLTAPPYTRRMRAGLILGALTCAILALGFGLTGSGYPYRLLYDYAPGWNGVRVPGRVFTTATLCLALLAGAGAQLLAARAARALGRGSPRRLSALFGAGLLAALIGEGAGHLAHPVVPQPKPVESSLPAPLLDLPTDGAADRVWQYFSTDGFYKIPVGNSTFDIPKIDDLRGGMAGFPDRKSVAKLRYYGIRTVVLHLKLPKLPGIAGYALPEPRDTAAAAARPTAGLGIRSRRVGTVVIYQIGPGPKALH